VHQPLPVRVHEGRADGLRRDLPRWGLRGRGPRDKSDR
jgi:hypothetical protein